MVLHILTWGWTYYYPVDNETFIEKEETPRKLVIPDEAKIRPLNRAPVGSIFTSARPTVTTWSFLGPELIDSLDWSDGKASGRVSYILVNPLNPDVVYIAAAGGGVWKTTDGGTTWFQIGDNLPALTSGALAMNPYDTAVIFYGTGEMHYCGDCFIGDGLFKSTDAGNTWVKVAGVEDVGVYISRIIVHPNDTNRIILATNIGIRISTDGGQTWTSPNFDVPLGSGAYDNMTDLVYRPDAPDTMFTLSTVGDADSGGVYVSYDGGFNWTRINAFPYDGFNGFVRGQIAIAPSNPDVMYVSFSDIYGELYAFYKSTDGGQTWTDITSDVPEYLCGQGWYDQALEVHPLDEDIVYAGGVHNYGSSCSYGLIRSTDGGNSWDEIAGSVIHPDIHDLAFSPSGDTLWVASDGGIWVSYDGGDTWVNRNQGLGITQFYTVSVNPVDNSLVLGGTQDNGTPIMYNGTYWVEVDGGDGGANTWLTQGGSSVPDTFFTSYVMMLYVSRRRLTSGYPEPSNSLEDSDVGSNTGGWCRTFGWRTDCETAAWTTAPLLYDTLNGILYAGTVRLYKSTDAGATWTAISDSLVANPGASSSYLLSVGITSSPDTIYAGSNDGFVGFTPDGGLSWYDISPDWSAYPYAPSIPDIQVAPTNGSEAFICIGDEWGYPSIWPRVLYTNDAGNTWVDISGNLPAGYNCWTIEVFFASDPANQDTIIYIGTDRGVYYSRFDPGNPTATSWSVYGLGLPSAVIYDLQLYTDATDTLLFAATHGRGVWVSAALTPLSSPETGPILVENPVDIRVKDRYVIFSEETPYSIYDIAGRLLKDGRGKQVFMDRSGIFIVHVPGRTRKVFIR